jgi:Spy/CpxP family protein refolding chaperone
MKRSKILPTLLSLATISLSIAALQAHETDQHTPRHHFGERFNGVEISDELQQLIADFREQRAALMEDYREVRLAHRNAMVDLIEELKSQPEDSEEWEAAKAAIIAKRAEFRETYGPAIREAREAFRDLQREFREQLQPEGDG